jgi:hypothetical protein
VGAEGARVERAFACRNAVLIAAGFDTRSEFTLVAGERRVDRFALVIFPACGRRLDFGCRRMWGWGEDRVFDFAVPCWPSLLFAVTV